MNEKRLAESIIGWILFIAILILGKMYLETAVFFRLLIGLAFGYTLARADTGFAGSVNKMYRTGSIRLMKYLMLTFFLAALTTSALLVFKPEGLEYKLKIHPINITLAIGAIIFGIGMALSSCCGSGTLTDLVVDFPRGIITVIFFMIGVFAAFPLQKKTDFINKSYITSASSDKGVFLPDWFTFDGLNGYIGAVVFTGILCLLVVYLAERWQKKQIEAGYNVENAAELYVIKMYEEGSEQSKLYPSLYDRVFIKPWTLKQGAIGLAIVFTLLMAGANTGWSVTSAFGDFFGRILYLFGVSEQALIEYTGYAAEKAPFAKSIFASGGQIQNFGIILGALIYLLLSKKWLVPFKSSMHITGKQAIQYVIGGLLMGVGTRIANGCNAGGLFTPIAQFSLSGWFFLIFMFIGGWVGNMIACKDFRK